MEKPKRIWAYQDSADSGLWSTSANDWDTEYVRADLAPGWQPIETAPQDGTKFLAYEARDVSHYPCWWNNDFPEWVGWQDDWDTEPDPTHWMPLPAAPEVL